MITGKEDMIGSLIEAYLMEKGTKDFYHEAAEKAEHSEAKKIFKELTAWEDEHMGYIQYLYQSINGDIDFGSFEDFQKRSHAPLTETGIPVKELDKKLEKYKYTDEKGAITLAMKIEARAMTLYRDLSRSAEDSNAKVVFEGMMQQEVKHMDYLKSLKAKLAQ
jgi:rubrerythrin